jgi:hypothetical protein
MAKNLNENTFGRGGRRLSAQSEKTKLKGSPPQSVSKQGSDMATPPRHVPTPTAPQQQSPAAPIDDRIRRGFKVPFDEEKIGRAYLALFGREDQFDEIIASIRSNILPVER